MHALLDRSDEADRAFVDAGLRMRWARTEDARERDGVLDLHRALVATSARAHAERREEIRSGRLRGAALRRVIEKTPLERRDHFVEELLGVAYPPLDEPALVDERMPYTPSGYDQITHALETTQLRAGQRFVDIGSGMGKVVLLAALLGGADAIGIEHDPILHDLAVEATRALDVPLARFECIDARHASIADVDVLFMYIPFTGNTLRTALDRFMEQARASPRRRHLCTSAIDRRVHPALEPVGEPRSWLQVYAWG